MALDQVEVDEKVGGSMSFIQHIEELRGHIIRSILAVFVLAIIAFLNAHFIFDTLLLGPQSIDFWTYRKMCELSQWVYSDDRLCLKKMGFFTQNIKMSGQFTQHIFVSLISGAILAAPYLLWELWRFIKPALSIAERRKTTGFVSIASLLFFIGVLFGYFILTPISVNFLGNYSVSDKIENIIALDSYISFVATLTLASGAIFELPIVIYFLARIGIVSSGFLSKNRRYAIIVILILSAIITPPDLASQILMSIPMVLLYQVGIFIARRVEKKRK
jgi:sec-independent protein translocase protein TatC